MRSTIASLVTLLTVLIAGTAQAVVYDVNRSFTNGASTASLIGTLTIPIGSYTMGAYDASPFTNVNLSLTVNSTSYNLINALTGASYGSGYFIVNATPTALTFSTANGSSITPA